VSGSGLRGLFGRGLRQRAKRVLGPLLRRRAPRRVDLPLSLWRLERDAAGGLRLDGVELASLLDRFGSPLHLVDAARLAGNAERFTARPPGASRACEVYSSYKTNPVPGVLRELHARGIGAEVVSPYELWLALRLGVDPAAIVYNGPAKSEASLAEAVGRGIGLVNVNARTEIAPLAALARRLGRRVRTGVRVVIPGGWGGQFGERIDTGAALRAYEEARACPELEVVAVHAHSGSEIATRAGLDGFLDGVLAFADSLRQRLRLEVQILDLGGSLACPTVSRIPERAQQMAVTFGCEPVPRPPEAVLSIDAYVARVAERIEGHCAARGIPPPRVFLEPGRALTGNAQMLLSRVVQVRDPDDAGMTWAVLDAGINVAETVRGTFHQLFPVVEPPGAPRRLHRLTGPSCMQGDLLYPAWELPALSVGDAVAIMDAGAYFVPFSTDFSFPRPPVVMLAGGIVRPLRHGEAFEDLVALDEGLGRSGAAGGAGS